LGTGGKGMIKNKFLQQILENKKVLIYLDDYSHFHKMHRQSEYNEWASITTLYFIYNCMTANINPRYNKINRLIDNKIKVLVIDEEIDHLLPTNVDVVTLKEVQLDKLKEYDIIINLEDSGQVQRNSRRKGFHELITQNPTAIDSDSIYIMLCSSRGIRLGKELSFPLSLKQTFHGRKYTGVMTFSRIKEMCTRPQKVLNSTIPFGPWPLDFIDFTWKTFTKWPSVLDLQRKARVDRKKINLEKKKLK
jgi:hypothetical protein